MKRSMMSFARLSVLLAIWVVPAGAQNAEAPSKALHVAAMDGDIAQIKLHIAKGTNVNTPDKGGIPPLCYAAEHAGTEATKLLLDAGAQVNAKGALGRTVLMGATQGRRGDVVDMLIAAGADVKAKDDRQITALHIAAVMGQVDIAETLIKAGADINAEDKLKQTPLVIARNGGMVEMVDFLKKQGATEPAVTGYDDYASAYSGATQGAAPVAQAAAPEIEIDPSAIREELAKFPGLAEAIKPIDDKSMPEQRGWMQRRIDNRATLVRTAATQFAEELAFVKKVATEDKAAKTIPAIDELAAKRKVRCEQIAKELIEERRTAMQQGATSNTNMNRGRTTTRGRSSRDSSNQNSMNPYETTTTRTPMRAARAEPNEPPIDPVTQAQMQAWLAGNPDSKDTLLETVHRQDLADLDALRTIATEEHKNKTAAALSGVMLARDLRLDNIHEEWTKEDERMQKQQERMGPEGTTTTRGRTRGGATQQDDSARRGTRRYR